MPQRRRTQIRLAQRAYRLRKENTINQLKEQVTTLQKTIEEMSRAFLAFNDSAMNSGILRIRPELAQQLKVTTERFVNLAKEAGRAGEDGHESSDADSNDGSHIPNLPNRSRNQPQRFNNPETLQLGRSRRSSSPEEILPTRDVLPMGYVRVTDDNSDVRTPSVGDTTMSDISSMPALSTDLIPSNSPTIDSLLQVGNTSYDKMSSSTNFNSQVFGVDNITFQSMPDPTNLSALRSAPFLPPELTLPYTYSFQETRFARRLHRATLERGFHLLSTAHLRPAAFSHVFRLSLLYSTRDALLERFKQKLSLPTDTPLEYYNTPFIHLGGAGLHYPKRKVANAFIVKPGPVMPGMRSAKARLENADKTGEAYDIDLDLQEYEGEWFDANDVEGFLEEKGVRVDGINGTFADADLVGDVTGSMSPASNVFTPSGLSDTTEVSPKTPVLSEESLEFGAARLFPELAALDPSAGLDNMATGWLMGSGDKTPDFLRSGWAEDNQMFASWNGGLNDIGNVFGDWNVNELPQPTKAIVPKTRAVTIDVDKFINGEFGLKPPPEVISNLLMEMSFQISSRQPFAWDVRQDIGRRMLSVRLRLPFFKPTKV